ncbi:c-type cytochrome [Aquimarina muelleri]|uniref:c-type cytochrome n=1 Tax=Aquimarina muelleri TaxID=279356 RepID=UPI003F682365
MKNSCRTILLLFITILSVSCSSSDENSESDPAPTNPNPNKITTYNADVKSIIDNQCISCHTIPLAEGAPFAMRNYAETINGVNRDLVLRIKSNGQNVMPPAGRLPQATIDIILDWEADGFKEN